MQLLVLTGRTNVPTVQILVIVKLLVKWCPVPLSYFRKIGTNFANVSIVLVNRVVHTLDEVATLNCV